MESPLQEPGCDAAPTILPMPTGEESPLLVLNFKVGGAHCRTFAGDPRASCPACRGGACTAFPVQYGQWACVLRKAAQHAEARPIGWS